MPEPPSDFDVPSDKDAIASTPAGQSQHSLVTANRYEGAPRNDHRGALLEETSTFRSDVELFYDLYTVVWDADLGETHDVRNGAVASRPRRGPTTSTRTVSGIILPTVTTTSSRPTPNTANRPPTSGPMPLPS
jgi:hypothetical protein